jgi:hypothetical protein
VHPIHHAARRPIPFRHDQDVAGAERVDRYPPFSLFAPWSSA